MSLFCIAYLDPRNQAHDAMGQAVTVARYDLAIVNLLDPLTRNCGPWLDRARAINPALKVIAYVQMATQDFTPNVSGMTTRQAHPLAWLPGETYNGRLYSDYQAHAWQDAFHAGCEATLRAYPVDGLFFDNCAVWAGHVRHPDDGPAQSAALQAAITEQRRRHPSAILIGNTSERWMHLNGALNEGRPGAYPTELQSSRRHTAPEMKLAHVYTDDAALIATTYAQAKQYGAWFGAGPSPQVVKWYDAFN
jgi:hypothetical protein